MSTLERLGSMDRTWLQIERDTNLMQVLGVLILATPLDKSLLKDRLRSRLLNLERFRQRVLRDSAGAIWESGPVDLERHLVESRLSSKDEKAALESLIGELAARPLNPNRPLWQLHLVHEYRGGSVLIARVHQCLADSIALIRVLRALTDASPDACEPDPHPRSRPNYLDRLYAPLTRAMIDGIQLSGAFWARYWSLLFYPAQLFDHARANTALALEIAKLNGLPDDSRSVLKKQPVGIKQVSWTRPLADTTLEGLAAAHKTSVNAILLSCLAGALRDYLAGEEAAAPGLELRILMPANLRSEESAEALGNRSGLVPLELPLGIADRLERLAELDRRVQVFSTPYDADWTLGLLSLLGQTTRAVQQQALELLVHKSSALLCQVPGAPEARYLAGAKIVEEMFWSPPVGDMGLAISIVHYNAHYQIGLLVDAAMVARPGRIVEGVEAELLALAPPPARKAARRAPRKAA